MVIIRLGELQFEKSDDTFLKKVNRLDNGRNWIQAEREFRICRSLRELFREMQTFSGQSLALSAPRIGKP
jgi:hypothetical protein